MAMAADCGVICKGVTKVVDERADSWIVFKRFGDSGQGGGDSVTTYLFGYNAWLPDFLERPCIHLSIKNI